LFTRSPHAWLVGGANSFGIGAEHEHHEYSRPNISVPTERMVFDGPKIDGLLQPAAGAKPA
jgi:hypothetical protein